MEQRHERVYRFFRTRDATEAAGIAHELDARVVCLYGHDRVRFAEETLLSPLYAEAGARCLHLRDAPSRDAPSP